MRLKSYTHQEKQKRQNREKKKKKKKKKKKRRFSLRHGEIASPQQGLPPS